jgi:hypothetical protein
MPSARIIDPTSSHGPAQGRGSLAVACAVAWVMVSLVGCVQIDGGSIEANWVVRTYDGRAMDGCDCADPSLSRIRFVAALVDPSGALGADVCAGRPECEFSCNSQRGATPFFVPAGRYAVSLSAIGPAGQVLPTLGGKGGVHLQAPILRDVVFGQPTQLEAFAIEANCADRCGGDQTTQACSAD